MEDRRTQREDWEKKSEHMTFWILLGFNYEEWINKPAMTIEACEEVDKITGAVICKNLFCATDRKQTFISC